MTCYADYDYYADIYRGKQDAVSFEETSSQASDYVRYYTHGRSDDEQNHEIVEKVRHCTCRVADVLYKLFGYEQESDGGSGAKIPPIKSETQRNYKVEYATASEIERAELLTGGIPVDDYIYRIIERCLSYTGLLYAGTGGDYNAG